jgi:hypothetical protein
MEELFIEEHDKKDSSSEEKEDYEEEEIFNSFENVGIEDFKNNMKAKVPDLENINEYYVDPNNDNMKIEEEYNYEVNEEDDIDIEEDIEYKANIREEEKVYNEEEFRDNRRNAKNKRPPARYGNRHEQVSWNEYNNYSNKKENRSYTNLPEYSQISQNVSSDMKSFDNKIKISSEFRKILRSKLARNSDKILANLKKLKQTTSFSKRTNLVLDDETLRNTSITSRTIPDYDDVENTSYNKSGKKVKSKSNNHLENYMSKIT